MGFHFSHFPGKNFENPMGKISFFEKYFSVKLGLNTLLPRSKFEFWRVLFTLAISTNQKHFGTQTLSSCQFLCFDSHGPTL